MITKKELEEIKEIGRAVDALKKIQQEQKEKLMRFLKEQTQYQKKNKIMKEFNYGNKRKNYENI